MRKVLTVAGREYRAMVATKAFVLSLIVMPVLMFGGMLVLNMMNHLTKTETLTIAVWDPEDVFFTELVRMAEARNRQREAAESAASGRQMGTGDATGGAADTAARRRRSEERTGKAVSGARAVDGTWGPRSGGDMDAGPIPDVDLFVLERIEGDQLDDARRWELSGRVRSKQLHAFVEIPREAADWLQIQTEATLPDESSHGPGFGAGGLGPPPILFYSEVSGLDPARRWLGQAVQELAEEQRFRALGLSPQQVQAALTQIPIRSMELLQRQSDGSLRSEESRDAMTALILPMGIMMMMFMVIMLAAQPMLEAVLEEKTLRIAEVLLGSCNPTQLMMGKLLGTVAGSLTVFTFYLMGGLIFAWNQNLLDVIPLSVIPWFFLFQMLAVLFYSSIFLAIGVSVSQLKDAQPLMMPVWVLLLLPLLTWFVLVQKPDGSLAFWMSMFPPTASTVMLLRISTGITVPLWQILLSLGLLVATTMACVFVAGRIFRIGILWQGQAPKISDLMAWAFTK